MGDFNRRDILKVGVGATTALAGAGIVPVRAAEWTNTPEANASIRVLRWKQFIQAEFDKFAELTKAFSEKTGVKVKLEAESWEDIRPKAAVAANVGAGPDLIIGTLDDPFKFPDKLIDVTDVAEYLGAQYGGWYPVAEKYGKKGNSWIAIPQGATGGCMNYRISHMKAAGFEEFPKDLPGFLKLCQGLKKNNTPAGFALGHATGDANGWCHWLLWAHGGKLVDQKNQVAIDSPETIAALEYAKQLYATFIPGVLSWNDSNNNKAYLAGEISLTLNGISIWTVGKTSPDPKQQEIAKDTNHAACPIGPGGKSTEQQNVLVAYGYKYSKYPKAVKEYIRFMWDKANYDAWEVASNGYVSPPLPAYNDNPVWTSDPKITPFRDCLKRCLDNGYAGDLGNASAGAMGDFIVVDMFAEAASGSASPKDAAARAAERAKRYYQA
ncbi:ABC transporter substrate-binding protein [Bradyrhizobium sp. Tv2a-2]|uniref:ABC transporter substrate-binding protein n=1 Tax=Bradyrhizobium sp. Tv2a-2 TaxID=113395 RepID=UPI0004280CCF|nr:ABC transporter substrate-binding protein [Bradyrhizobium sp. Tv2a-2]